MQADALDGDRHSVHAVMINWNSYDLNAACIRSLQKSDYPFAKIIIVDNGSQDGSCERLQHDFAVSQVQFLKLSKNEGFSGGMNAGFRLALSLGAEMIFSVNNDTEIDAECLRHLVEGLDKDPSAGIAGPSIMYYANPNKIWQAGGYFRAIRGGVVVPWKGKEWTEIPPTNSQVSFLSGCAILLRRNVLEEIGFLDTSYFFYAEDLDYDLRVLQAGRKLLFVPSARLWHKIDDIASDRTSPYVMYHLARSTVLVYRKRFSPVYAWYGIVLQIFLYTPFRFLQIWKGRAGFQSGLSWLRGIWAGMTASRG